MLSERSPQLVGRAPAFLQALTLIERMARYDAPVLIVGETGTGKELAARAIHYQSERRDAPFVPLNCGAVPETLIESELFGCERGAFTDARQARSGLIAAAEGGTLFLDELDSLPLRAQVSLLRFLQDFRYRPVGGTRECRGDVRVVAAASPRLHELLETGAFRDDLAFRLNVLLLEMPPLRDRPGDAQVLAAHFIARHARQHALPPRALAPGCVDWIARYAWPGNVRELDNRVQRALMLSDGDELDLRPCATSAVGAVGAMSAMGATTATAASAASAASGEIVPDGRSRAGLSDRPASPGDLRAFNDAREEAMRHFERSYLEQLMHSAHGNVTHAARLAGKERRALGKLLKKHGLEHDGFEAPN